MFWKIEQNIRHEKKLKMSANLIFKQANVPILTCKKMPILSIQQGHVNMIWIFSYQRVYICPQRAGFSTANLLIQTQCGLFHKGTTDHMLCVVLNKNVHILDINVRKLGLQVCGFSHVCKILSLNKVEHYSIFVGFYNFILSVCFCNGFAVFV